MFPTNKVITKIVLKILKLDGNTSSLQGFQLFDSLDQMYFEIGNQNHPSQEFKIA